MSVTVRDPAQEYREHHMVIFMFEASQPNGTVYRIGIGCFMPPRLVSMVAALVRLF